MTEQRLEEIWRDNLREYNGNVRLDSIIIIAMGEACKEVKNNINDTSDINGTPNGFYIDLMKLINAYCKKGLSKSDLVKKMEYATDSCKMS